MGKAGCGSAVIQRRKPSCRPWALARYCSTSDRYCRPRWVFCSSTQCPSAAAAAMCRRATTSCPWPMDTPRHLILRRLASSSMSLVGSAPAAQPPHTACERERERFAAAVHACRTRRAERGPPQRRRSCMQVPTAGAAAAGVVHGENAHPGTAGRPRGTPARCPPTRAPCWPAPSPQTGVPALPPRSPRPPPARDPPGRRAPGRGAGSARAAAPRARPARARAPPRAPPDRTTPATWRPPAPRSRGGRRKRRGGGSPAPGRCATPPRAASPWAFCARRGRRARRPSSGMRPPRRRRPRPR